MDATDSFKLEDRTAILTGPCGAYNQAIATKLTQLGCDVAMIHGDVDRARRFAEQLMNAREIQERFGRAVALQASVGDPAQAQDAITRAAEAFGGIDIYIDGGFASYPKPFRDPSALEPLEELIDRNLRTPILLTHGLLRFVESRKRGRVIFLLHDLARLGVSQHALLSATRMGLIQFAKALARESAEKGLTVNCVAMGVTEDFLLSQAQPPSGNSGSAAPQTIQAAQAELAKAFPGCAVMDPERIANLVAFLASPLSSGITGQTIAASQGLSSFA